VSVLPKNLLKMDGELIRVYRENHEKRKNNYEFSTCMYVLNASDDSQHNFLCH
jgi:hypothetical protein